MKTRLGDHAALAPVQATQGGKVPHADQGDAAASTLQVVSEPRSDEDTVRLSAELRIAGLGVKGPLIDLWASPDRIQVRPRWQALAMAGIPSFELLWSDLGEIQELIGPRGGTRGIRLVLRHRGAARDRRGLARIFGPMARSVALGLTETQVQQLLAFAPPAIPRGTRRGFFFVWS